MIKYIIIALSVLVAYLAWCWSSLEPARMGSIAAYRGGGQLLDYNKLALTECSATSMISSESSYIENTINSLDRAVDIGVDILHINVRHTKDGEFVVFHDQTLDCATNGSGDVGASDSTEITQLDAAYKFTGDGGETYPFRGLGHEVSLLKTVLDRYPGSRIWINLKGNKKSTYKAIKRYLSPYKARHSSILLIINDKARPYFNRDMPTIRSISFESTKSCVFKYMLFGWSSVFPSECVGVPIMLPPKYVKYIWGYPNKFASQAQKHGSEVFLWAKHTNLESHSLYLRDGIGLVTGDLVGISKLTR